jgi:hypothetical protein
MKLTTSASLFLNGMALFVSLLHPTPVKSQDLSSLAVCQQGQLECVGRVIEEMQRRYDLLAEACDHNALFALAYLRTTEKFLETFETVGYASPADVIREDALFADYYFRAYDAYHGGSGIVSPAWQVAFEAARTRSLLGLGNLNLGFNAHITRDLAFVLYDLYLQGHPVNYEDHTQVNQFLQQVDILDEVAQKFDPSVDDIDLPGEEDDLQRFQVIAFWREQAYRNFERLRDARNEEERLRVAEELEAVALLSAEVIAGVYAYPPGSDSFQRDTYCQRCSNASIPEPNLNFSLLLLGGLGISARLLTFERF